MHIDRKKSENRAKDINDKSLEKIHRNSFVHLNGEKWNATPSLAQPSFLEQVNSCGRAHSQPVKISREQLILSWSKLAKNSYCIQTGE